MGKDRHKRRHRGPTFVQLFHYLLDSAAYQSLSLKARAALIEICRRYDGGNNGRIALSVREAAERMNCTKETASLAFRELVEKGFMQAAKLGWFSIKFRHSTEWRLTFYRDDVTGEPPTRAFQRWPAELNGHGTEIPYTTAARKGKNTVRNFSHDGTDFPDTNVSQNQARGTEIPDTVRTKRGTEIRDTCTSNQGGTTANDASQRAATVHKAIAAIGINLKWALKELKRRDPNRHADLIHRIALFDRVCLRGDTADIVAAGATLVDAWMSADAFLKDECPDLVPSGALGSYRWGASRPGEPAGEARVVYLKGSRK
jgi:hypothetical protein